MVIQTNKNKVILYDHPSELTLGRFKEYNKYVLVDSGIGTDLQGIQSHIAKLLEFSKNSDNTNYSNEVRNYMQGIYNISIGLNIKHYSFAILVKEIDGVKYEDFTSDGLNKVIERLEEIGLTQKLLVESLEEVKKKSSIT